MDLLALAAVLTALAGLVTAIGKIWLELRKTQGHFKKTQEDFDSVWEGIILRGFKEAEVKGHLQPDGEECWTVSADARKVYGEIAPDLKAIRKNLQLTHGGLLSESTLAWAIEQRFQKWMLEHACPTLGVNQHGCLAIAAIIARENGDHPTVLPD